MKILCGVYLLLFVSWFLLESWWSKNSGVPGWLRALDATAKAILVFGMFAHLSGVEWLSQYWFRFTVLAVGLESFVRGADYRNEEPDLDLPDVWSARINAIVLIGLIVSCIPAVAMNLAVAKADPMYAGARPIWFTAAIGIGAAMLTPMYVRRFSARGRKVISEWFDSSDEFESGPDDVVVVGSRRQDWPGLSVRPTTHLFLARFGDTTYVGLTGPVTHCFEVPVEGEIDASATYDQFKEWHADKLSRELIRDAAGELPVDLQEIVDEVLSDDLAE